MCQTKTVPVSLLFNLVLLVAASFCVYQARTENKEGHNSEIKSQGPCKASTRSLV